MKFSFFKSKSKRTKLFTLLSAVIIVAVFVLNLLLSYAMDNSVAFADMTMEGLYTVTDTMIEECSFLNDLKGEDGELETVKITFCTDPDYLMGSMITRMTYVLAKKLHKIYPNVEVETVNVAINPTAVAAYKATSLTEITAENIIVSYGDRYRVSNANGYWKQGNTYSDEWFYNGEYYLTSLIKSVTAINQPSAYFVIDHGEDFYDISNPESEMSLNLSAFYDLLVQRGLKVKTLSISEVEKIPDDCALLIINNPKTDFSADTDRFDELSYVSDTEKLDEYLVSDQGAIIVTRNYETTLPIFEDFLHEWGFEFSNTMIKDTENAAYSIAGDGSALIAEYDKSRESYGYAIYGEYSDLSSAPVTVFKNSGYVKCAFKDSTAINEPGTPNVTRRYAPFISTAKTAIPYAKSSLSGEYVDKAGNEGAYNLAAVSVREEFDATESISRYSYIFCVNSTDFLSSELLSNTSYANFDILSATVNNISRVDEYASTDLGGTTLNSTSYGGKRFITVTMSEEDFSVRSNKLNDPTNIGSGYKVIKFNHGLTSGSRITYAIIAALIPISIAVLGIVVCAKRRYK